VINAIAARRVPDIHVDVITLPDVQERGARIAKESTDIGVKGQDQVVNGEMMARLSIYPAGRSQAPSRNGLQTSMQRGAPLGRRHNFQLPVRRKSDFDGNRSHTA
jgi:hypothetical protein